MAKTMVQSERKKKNHGVMENKWSAFLQFMGRSKARIERTCVSAGAFSPITDLQMHKGTWTS